MINLIPGVQYTQDQVRGPSAGASGQDNVYNFDGVNVTLPLFGTLSAEPASHDIAQITVVKGGAKAIDFNRAGGFDVDSVSKSGTSTFHGLAGYRFQTAGMASPLNNGSVSRYDQDRGWTDLNVGGPILPDRLFFYGWYYRPTVTRNNASTAYGPVPNYDSVRNEGFGKLTLTPTHTTLVNVSYRSSHRLDTGTQFSQFTAGTAGTGNEAWQRIGTADGSWVINGSSLLTFKYTHFENPTQGRPDNVSSAVVNTAIGTHLDTNNFDQLGLLTVPKPGPNAAVNTFIQPVIDRYGFLCTPEIVVAKGCSVPGTLAGGGLVGFGTTFDEDNFFRDAGQVAYNLTLSGMGLRHNLHVGYQQYIDSEDLIRSSNGWGALSVPGGGISLQRHADLLPGDVPGAGRRRAAQDPFRVPAPRASKPTTRSTGRTSRSTSACWRATTRSTGRGFRTTRRRCPASSEPPERRRNRASTRCTTSPFSQMLQPRLGATWAYNQKDTIFASYARYNPAASSLPRAASWDRGLAVTQNADFDANANLFAVENVASSSGKLSCRT